MERGLLLSSVAGRSDPRGCRRAPALGPPEPRGRSGPVARPSPTPRRRSATLSRPSAGVGLGLGLAALALEYRRHRGRPGPLRRSRRDLLDSDLKCMPRGPRPLPRESPLTMASLVHSRRGVGGVGPPLRRSRRPRPAETRSRRKDGRESFCGPERLTLLHCTLQRA